MLAQALWVRLALFTPIAAVVIVAATLLRRPVLRYIPPWVHEGVVMASGVGAAATLFYILSISRSPLIQYYHVGLMVVLMYGNMVQRLSRVDALTGLFNRRHMDEVLLQLCRRAAHDEGVLAIEMIDVDHFKAYNDHYGHPAGDQCLTKVAQALAESLRQSTDVIGRYGGEEFIAVLPHAQAEAARRAAQRLVHAVAALGLAHARAASAAHRIEGVSFRCSTLTQITQGPSECSADEQHARAGAGVAWCVERLPAGGSHNKKAVS